MKKREKKQIQEKIEGNLSLKEEKEIDSLTSKSIKARKYYQHLLKIHQLLHNDSQNIPKINLTNSISKAISSPNSKRKINIINLPKIGKYAAILVFGLFIGSMFTYLLNKSPLPDQNAVSGTFAKTPDQSIDFVDEETTIKIQSTKLDNTSIKLLTIKTSTPITMILNDIKHSGNKIEVTSLSKNEKPIIEQNNENTQIYTINNSCIVQLKDTLNTHQYISILRGEKKLLNKIRF